MSLTARLASTALLGLQRKSLTHQVKTVKQYPSHQAQQGREGCDGSAFFLPILLSISAARDPQWRLETAVAGCPGKSCPHSLCPEQSILSVVSIPGGGRGACISLCVVPSALSVTRQGPATIPPPPPGAPRLASHCSSASEHSGHGA